jgi:nucleotide-binding universal stress UspA family protein
MRREIIRTIVAATDLTEASDEVLRAAGRLALETGATLHAVHALDFPPAPYLDDVGEVTGFQEKIDAAEQALWKQVGHTVPAGVPIGGCRLEIYAAHRAIAEYADAVGADLIVLGPHTRRQLEVGFLGTTADRVIRSASCPVLVVRGALRLPFRRMVAPIDLSERSGRVLDAALAWGEVLGEHDTATGMPVAELSIVHVMPRLFAVPGMPFSRAEVRPGMNREVQAALRRAGGAPSVDVREEVVWDTAPPTRSCATPRKAAPTW